MHKAVCIGREGFVCISLRRQRSCLESLFRSGVSIEVHFTFVGEANRIVGEIAGPGGSYVWIYATARCVAFSFPSLFWQWIIS